MGASMAVHSHTALLAKAVWRYRQLCKGSLGPQRGGGKKLHPKTYEESLSLYEGTAPMQPLRSLLCQVQLSVAKRFQPYWPSLVKSNSTYSVDPA